MAPSRGPLKVQARNLLLFSRREAARAGVQLPSTDGRAKHIHSQLKAKAGDIVRIGVVNGLKGSARVKEVGPDGVLLVWNTWQEPAPPPPITLLLAMPRPKVLKRLWRRIPELGVRQVIITQTDRVPAGYGTSETLRPHVVLRQLLQGLEQAGETVLPQVMYTPSLAGAVRCAVKDSEDLTALQKEAEKEWQEERLLVQGPRVRHAIHERLDAALPAAVESAGAPQGSSQRLAFITQCLQVRRQIDDRRAMKQRVAEAAPVSGFAAVSVDEDVPGLGASLREPLRLVCEPGAMRLLSTAVTQYKQRMNSEGLHVWNWSELKPERSVADAAEEAAGDRYYGGAMQDCDDTAESSLAEILAESFNQEDGDIVNVPQAIGDVDVGTTKLDASRWGVGRVVVAIGPERGWTDQELALLRGEGFGAVGMGSRTLSSPTAVIAALAICQEALR